MDFTNCIFLDEPYHENTNLKKFFKVHNSASLDENFSEDFYHNQDFYELNYDFKKMNIDRKS